MSCPCVFCYTIHRWPVVGRRLSELIIEPCWLTHSLWNGLVCCGGWTTDPNVSLGCSGTFIRSFGWSSTYYFVWADHMNAVFCDSCLPFCASLILSVLSVGCQVIDRGYLQPSCEKNKPPIQSNAIHWSNGVFMQICRSLISIFVTLLSVKYQLLSYLL